MQRFGVAAILVYYIKFLFAPCAYGFFEAEKQLLLWLWVAVQKFIQGVLQTQVIIVSYVGAVPAHIKQAV